MILSKPFYQEMRMSMQKVMSRKMRAFTLVELLIVVAIIAIISAIGVPMLLRAFYLAKDKKVMAEMRAIAVTIGIYSVDREMVPQTNNIAVLIQTLKNYQAKSGDFTAMDVEDAWGHQFTYTSVSQSGYTLMSYGRDGLVSTPAGTENFNADDDLIVISGIFVASHQGTTSVVGN
jgi:general secretion pathway protein G